MPERRESAASPETARPRKRPPSLLLRFEPAQTSLNEREASLDRAPLTCDLGVKLLAQSGEAVACLRRQRIDAFVQAIHAPVQAEQRVTDLAKNLNRQIFDSLRHPVILNPRPVVRPLKSPHRALRRSAGWLLVFGFVVSTSAFAQGEEFNPPPNSEAQRVEPNPPPVEVPEHQRVQRAPETRRSAEAAPAVRLTRITMGPTLLLFGQLPIEYERGVTEDLSFYVGARLTFPAIGALVGQVSYGGTTTFGLRMFPMAGQAPQGLWLGVETEAGYNWTTSLGVTVRTFAVHGAATGGYTFIAANGFTVSSGLGLGMGYSTAGFLSTGPGLVPALTLHLNAGYAF